MVLLLDILNFDILSPVNKIGGFKIVVVEAMVFVEYMCHVEAMVFVETIRHLLNALYT